jgi:hypothetical protein
MVAGLPVLATPAATAHPDTSAGSPVLLDAGLRDPADQWAGWLDRSGALTCLSEAMDDRVRRDLRAAETRAATAAGEQRVDRRAAVHTAASRSIAANLAAAAPGVGSAGCRRDAVTTARLAFERAVGALPDRPSVWRGVVVGAQVVRSGSP